MKNATISLLTILILCGCAPSQSTSTPKIKGNNEIIAVLLSTDYYAIGRANTASFELQLSENLKSRNFRPITLDPINEQFSYNENNSDHVRNLVEKIKGKDSFRVLLVSFNSPRFEQRTILGISSVTSFNIGSVFIVESTGQTIKRFEVTSSKTETSYEKSELLVIQDLIAQAVDVAAPYLLNSTK
jgi:hypothetical protein